MKHLMIFMFVFSCVSCTEQPEHSVVNAVENITVIKKFPYNDLYGQVSEIELPDKTICVVASGNGNHSISCNFDNRELVGK